MFYGFFNQLQQISVLFVGIFFMNKNLLSFQNMIAYISYANMYSESLSEICNINVNVQNLCNSIQHIYELCKRMNIYNDIVNMNEGFSTILYNNASNLSVGQRQRLALVRAVLIKPKILLCDEIIANIDQNSREIIMSFLRSKIDKMLIIFVTHQLYIISDYDMLLEIKNDGGRKV